MMKPVCCAAAAQSLKAEHVAGVGSRWLLEARGTCFQITHCPWCGTKLPDLSDETFDKIARTVVGAHARLTRALNITGEAAPIHIYHREMLYSVSISIQPAGSLGPGSVLLTTVKE